MHGSTAYKDNIDGGVWMVTKKKAIRRILPEYEINPSVLVAAQNNKIGALRKVSKDGQQCLLFPDTGEMAQITPAPAILHNVIEKDTEQFVKIFPGFVKSVNDLSSAADKVFKLVYQEVLNSQDKDTIDLYYKTSGLSKATFERGLTELLEKEVLFKSLYPTKFFININYMFNGDRLAIVTEYRRKGSDYVQEQLPGL